MGATPLVALRFEESKAVLAGVCMCVCVCVIYNIHAKTPPSGSELLFPGRISGAKELSLSTLVFGYLLNVVSLIRCLVPRGQREISLPLPAPSIWHKPWT